MMKIFENATENKLARLLRKISLRRIPFHKISLRNMSIRKMITFVRELSLAVKATASVVLIIGSVFTLPIGLDKSLSVITSLLDGREEQAEPQPQQAEEQPQQAVTEEGLSELAKQIVDELAKARMANETSDTNTAEITEEEILAKAKQIAEQLIKERMAEAESDATTDEKQLAETSETQTHEMSDEKQLAEIMADKQVEKFVREEILKFFSPDTETQPAETPESQPDAIATADEELLIEKTEEQLAETPESQPDATADEVQPAETATE